MKNLYILIALFFFFGASAQTINIPDSILKAKLLGPDANTTVADQAGQNIIVDSNGDGEIDLAEVQNVYKIKIRFAQGIQTFTGLQSFPNLKILEIYRSTLVNADFSGMSNLDELLFTDDLVLTDINIAGCSGLINLNLSRNHAIEQIDFASTGSQQSLKTLELTSNLMLTSVSIAEFSALEMLVLSGSSSVGLLSLQGTICSHLYLSQCSSITDLDLSNTQCVDLGATGMTALLNLNIKNGLPTYANLSNSPNVQYVCKDDDDILTNAPASAEINSYCTFVPGGDFYSVIGTARYDLAGDGCDINDNGYSHLPIVISGTSFAGSAVLGVVSASNSGNYNITLSAGNYTLTPNLENITYFNVSPESVSVNFPTDSSPLTQNFCLTPNGIKNDLEIVIIPTWAVRPGTYASYKLIYKNKGNTILSGNINFAFGNEMQFVSSSEIPSYQTQNSLSYSFTNFEPFQTRTIDIILLANTPLSIPPLDAGSSLDFTATISDSESDQTPDDNIFTLNQIVVNSYDPNDKTCLEGNTISPAQVGKYLHYLIRFENNGTASAENIVVKDIIDLDKFDISTIIPMDGSHDFYMKLNDNKVEFIFENINLPFDDATNDGYVMFKIKTKSDLVIGDSVSNSASIYFDYNFPINTEPAITTIAALKTQEFASAKDLIVYPNPVKDILNIKADLSDIKSLEIYNILGQKVLIVTNAENAKSFDVSNLKSGSYFLKVQSPAGNSVAKFIKN